MNYYFLSTQKKACNSFLDVFSDIGQAGVHIVDIIGGVGSYCVTILSVTLVIQWLAAYKNYKTAPLCIPNRVHVKVWHVCARGS